MTNLNEHYVVTVGVKRVYRTPDTPATPTSRSLPTLKPGERIVEDITSLSATRPTLKQAIGLAVRHLTDVGEDWEGPQ